MYTTQLAIVVPATAVVVVAVVNAFLQYKTNGQNLRHSTKLAVQARVAEAYEDMLELVDWQMELVNATKPVLEEANAKPPERPDSQRIHRVQARIGVHGAPEVKEILGRWAKRRTEFFSEALLLDAMQNDPLARAKGVKEAYGVSMTGQWGKVTQAREDLHAMVRELEDAANAEARAA